MSWRLARALEQLRTEVRVRWPGTTVWTIGDADHAARWSDHNPNAVGVVTAVDVVGRAQAAALWDELLDAADPRVKYLIFDRQIVSATTAPWTPRPYSGSNAHADHIHVSVGRGLDGRTARPDLYDDPAPWGLNGMTEEDDVYVVKHGQGGARVKRAQVILQVAGDTLGLELLPKYGADGDYGGETAAAVDTIAARAKLPADGATGMDILVLDYCRMLLEGGRAVEGGGLSQADADARYVRRGSDVTIRIP